MNETIKPCPFCGGAAYLTTNYSARIKRHFVFCKCDICGGQSKAYTSETDPAEGWNNEACDAAIRAWNTRKYDPPEMDEVLLLG